MHSIGLPNSFVDIAGVLQLAPMIFNVRHAKDRRYAFGDGQRSEGGRALYDISVRRIRCVVCYTLDFFIDVRSTSNTSGAASGSIGAGSATAGLAMGDRCG